MAVGGFVALFTLLILETPTSMLDVKDRFKVKIISFSI